MISIVKKVVISNYKYLITGITSLTINISISKAIKLNITIKKID